MKPVRLFVLGLLVSGVQGINWARFLSDFALYENTGRVRVCNFINTWGHDNIHLIKAVSARLRCSVTINPPSRPISDWFVLSHLQLFVLDMNNPDFLSVLRQAEKLKIFDNNIWLIINRQEGRSGTELVPHQSSALSAFRDVDISIISQIHIADQVSVDRINLRGVYKRDPNTRLLEEKLGYWTEKCGVVYTAERSPALRRLNMEGRMFKGAMVITNEDSLNHMNDLIDPHIDNLTKLNYVLANLVIEALNASINYKISNKWGEMINGSFDGLIGYAQRKEVEILASPMIVSYERVQVLEFFAVTSETRVKFILMAPPLSYRNNLFILPFGPDVWCCSCAFFGIFVTVLHLAFRYDEVPAREIGSETGKVTENLSWIDVIMVNFATMCQQAFYVEPKSISGRIIFITARITFLFLYVSYSAAIVVLLQASDRSMTTLKDLDKSNFKIGAHEIVYNHYWFKASNDPTTIRLGSKLGNEYLTPEEGVEKVRHGYYAFYIERVPGYHMVRKNYDEGEKCRLQELKESVVPDLDVTLALTKHCPYSKTFRIMYKKIAEFGLINREARYKPSKKPPCTQRNMAYSSVSLMNCYKLFVLLSYGMVASVMILAGEKIRYKRIDSKRKTYPIYFEFYN